jgi:hypothetical protein
MAVTLRDQGHKVVGVWADTYDVAEDTEHSLPAWYISFLVALREYQPVKGFEVDKFIGDEFWSWGGYTSTQALEALQPYVTSSAS